MRCVFGQTDSRQVDVHPTVRLIRPEQFHSQIGLLLVQAAVVIGIDDADVALPGVDGFKHRNVIGEHVSGQVIDPALENLLGFIRAIHFDHRGGERLVVDLFSRTKAQAPFPLFVGKCFVSRQFFGFYPVGGIGNGPRTQAQACPLMGRRAVLRRDVLINHVGLERLQNAHLFGLPKVTGVYGEQQIGGGVFAFGLDALHKRRFLIGDELDLDPGLGGVSIKYRLDQLIDTRGIHHHFIGSRHTARKNGKGQGSQ